MSPGDNEHRVLRESKTLLSSALILSNPINILTALGSVRPQEGTRCLLIRYLWNFEHCYFIFKILLLNTAIVLPCTTFIVCKYHQLFHALCFLQFAGQNALRALVGYLWKNLPFRCIDQLNFFFSWEKVFSALALVFPCVLTWENLWGKLRETFEKKKKIK